MHNKEMLPHCTVRLESENVVGTGFFYVACGRDDKKSIPLIITNKHVIAGAKKLSVKFTTTKGGKPDYGSYITINLDLHNGVNHIVQYPDENIDLCAIPIAGILSALQNKKIFPYIVFTNNNVIIKHNELQELQAIENIIMIGYPIGLYDEINNIPIIRKGITATPPYLDWNGEKKFLIDMACFPGSSGSPIFLTDDIGFTDKRGNMILGNSRLKLLGILYAVPQLNANGKIKIIEIPTNIDVISETQIPINLGYVLRAELLSYFDDFYCKKTEIYNNLSPWSAGLGNNAIPSIRSREEPRQERS